METSRNDFNYREHAQYFYYPHGPLQRTELGGQPHASPVQGIDYSYTLQGWLKGVNGDVLRSSNCKLPHSSAT